MTVVNNAPSYRRWRAAALGLSVAVVCASLTAVAWSPRPARAASSSAPVAPGAATQNSGAYTTTVPIEVPPFHGLEPKLALVYNSSAGNGEVGLGWQVAGESYVERTSPGRGSPNFDSTDVFQLDGEPLVASTTFGGNYVTKRQTFQRIIYDSAANVWYAWDTHGTKRTYGAQFSPSLGVPITRWLLTEVRDLHNNAVGYNYSCDSVNFYCYLDSVVYNSYVSVRLYRETRPDPIVISGAGGMMRIAYRVKTIDVTVAGNRARAYAIAYVKSAVTERSLLRSVWPYGTDAVLDASGTIVGGTARRGTTYDYAQDMSLVVSSPYDWHGTMVTQNLGFCGVNAGYVLTGDFNGDGMRDLACDNPLNPAGADFQVAIGTGTGFNTPQSWAPGPTALCDPPLAVDVNGDGKDDLFCDDSSFISVAISTGAGFGPWTRLPVGGTSAWCAVKGYSYAAFGVGDFNSDGLPDAYCWSAQSGAISVTLSVNGTSYGAGSVWATCAGTNSLTTGDVNGDGRTDVLCYNPTSGHVDVGLSRATSPGFTPLTTWATATQCDTAKLTVGDFNGDGKSDIVCADKTTGAVLIGLSHGTGGFSPLAVWAGLSCKDGPLRVGDFTGDARDDVMCMTSVLPLKSAIATVAASHGDEYFVHIGAWYSSGAYWCQHTDQKLMTEDFNGDGRPDLGCYDQNTQTMSLAVAGTLPHTDLLTSVTTDLGGTISLTYAIQHAGRLPSGYRFAALTTQRFSPGVNLGVDVVTNYAYGASLWDPVERRFLGYQTVTTSDGSASQASTSRTVTSFALWPSFATNIVTSVDRQASDGSSLQRTDYQHNTYANVGGSYQAQVAVRVDTYCERSAYCQRVQVQYSYDGYGNVTWTREQGDLAVTGDERNTTTGYDYNTVTYLVDTPNSTMVRAGLAQTGTLFSAIAYGHNSAGDLTSTNTWNNTTNTYASASAVYDGYGDKTSTTDEIGHTITFTYDWTFKVYPVTVCVAPGDCRTDDYNTVTGWRNSSTEANGARTSWTYDPMGRQILETRPTGETTTTSYVNWGDPKNQYIQQAVSDGTPDGLWKRSYVDGLGRDWQTLSEPDIFVMIHYNPQGLRDAQTVPFRPNSPAPTTSYVYDALGRLTQLQHPDGSAQTISYLSLYTPTDSLFAVPRRATTTCDEVGICRRVTYDAYTNALSTSEWTGYHQTGTEYRTENTYDLAGNRLSTRDALGNMSWFTWDSLGRKVAMTDPDTGTWSYGYDGVGHLISQKDGRGQTITMTYDSRGRLTQQLAGTKVLANYTWENGPGPNHGHIVSMTDAQQNATVYGYDLAGRTISVNGTVRVSASTYQPYTVKASYDTAGRRSSLTYPTGEVVKYTYDAQGCLTGVGTYVTAATCTPAMSVATRTLGDGVSETFSYDPNRLWLTADTATAATGGVLQNETYSHYANGQEMSKGSADAADQWSYSYDGQGRLQTATNTTTPSFSSTYGYDAIGRITSGTGIAASTYPAVGQPHQHAPSTVGGVSYTYDAAGNRTGDVSSTYTYDELGRMTAVAEAGNHVYNYQYDALGQRVYATVPYVPVGQVGSVYFEGQLIYQHNGAWPISYYYYGKERIAAYGTSGVAPTLLYFVNNGLGTPHLLVGSPILVSRVFSPYGALLKANETGSWNAIDPIGMAGQYRDPTHLYQMGARYMSPTIGAFLSPDTSGNVDPTKPQTLNRYSYANNDPVDLIDPTGAAALPGDAHGPISLTVNEEAPHQAIVAIDLEVINVSIQMQSGNIPGRFNIGMSLPLAFGSVGGFAGVQFWDGSIVGAQAGVAGNVYLPIYGGIGGDIGGYVTRVQTENGFDIRVKGESNIATDWLMPIGVWKTVWDSGEVSLFRNIYPQSSDPAGGEPFGGLSTPTEWGDTSLAPEPDPTSLEMSASDYYSILAADSTSVDGSLGVVNVDTYSNSSFLPFVIDPSWFLSLGIPGDGISKDPLGDPSDDPLDGLFGASP